jgi:processive 1,2-diacylglycerol beta-glucosyltransferase
VRAAQAVEKALRRARPDASVQHVDVLELATPAFRRAYGKGYLDLAGHAPHLFGWLYDTFDKPSRSGKGRGDRLALMVERLNLRRLRKLLDAERPDIVACTHFLPAALVASRRRRGRFDVPMAVVLTDFEAHRLWANEPCELYTVAHEIGAVGLAAWGVPRERIHVTGIPIDLVFEARRHGGSCRRAFDLATDRPVVLQLSGGFGIGQPEAVLAAIEAVERPIHVVAVTGRNEAARKRLEAMPPSPRHRRTVLGFTDRIDELMAAADLVVTKPGGLTTSECMARGVPMLIVSPIPGQEMRNADLLLEEGAAVKANSLALITMKVGELVDDAPRLERLAAATQRLARPHAARDIAELCLSLA